VTLPFKSEDFLKGLEVNIVGGVDGLWNAINFVRNFEQGVRFIKTEERIALVPGFPRRICELSSISSILFRSEKK
jgi:hypothetical protein